MIVLFGKALVMGLAIAAPLGPIGALCINRTLAYGFAAGVAGGFGTALADAVYATAAATGFAAFSAAIDRVATPLALAGGLFLIWLGLLAFRSGPPPAEVASTPQGGLRTMAATFALTLTNPMTVLSFAAIFAALGLAQEAGMAGAVVVVAGVFTGSMLWWVILSGGVALARRRLPEGFAALIARVSALVMIGFGLWSLTGLLQA